MTWLVLAAVAATPTEQCSSTAYAGQVLRDERRWLEASKQFVSCAQEACPKVVRNDCARWRSELEDAIPTLLIAVQADGADVTDAEVELDGAPLQLIGTAVSVDPGPHVLVARRGARSVTLKVLALERDKARKLVLALEPEPAPVVVTPRATSPAPGVAAPSPAPAAARRGAGLGWVGPVALGAVGVGSTLGSIILGASGRARIAQLAANPCAETRTCVDDGPRGQLVVADVLLWAGLAVVAAAVAWGVVWALTQ